MDVVRTPVREYGLKGVIKDVRPWDVPASSFTSAIDVRIEDASITTLGDIALSVGPFVDHATGLTEIKPVFSAPFWVTDHNAIVMVFDNGEVRCYYAFAGDGTGSYSLQLAEGTLDTTADFYSTQAGLFFILTSLTNLPQIMGAEGVEVDDNMITMPGWPANYRAGVMENYKNMLVAAQLTVDGVDQPNTVKWSHPYSEGSTQYFWDPGDPTLLAGENPIQTDGQGVTALQPLRDSLMVYFDRSMWRMDFVGGQFVMNFTKVFSDDGALDKYAVVNVEGRSLVVGLRDIYTHNGVQKKSVSDLKLTRWFYGLLNLDYPVRLDYYPTRNEIWIVFRSRITGASDTALIYNTLHDAFTEIDLANKSPTGAGTVIGMFLGPRLRTDVDTYATVSASEPAPDGPDYDVYNVVSYKGVYTSPNDTVFYALTDGTGGGLWELDSITGDPVLRQSLLIEHLRLDLDTFLETTGDKVVYVSRVYPHLSGIGRIQIRFGTANNTSEGIKWEAWTGFVMGTDYAIDLRVAGRYLAYQIRPFSGETPHVAISGFDLEWAVVGEQ